MTRAGERTVRSQARVRSVASVTAFQVVIAITVGFACLSALRNTDASARQLGLTAVLPSTAAAFVLAALAGVGLGLAVLLMVPATRGVAAGFVSLVLTLSSFGLLVAWADGQPARCLCLSGAAHQSGLAHLSTFVTVASLAAVSWAASVAQRRTASASSRFQSEPR